MLLRTISLSLSLCSPRLALSFTLSHSLSYSLLHPFLHSLPHSLSHSLSHSPSHSLLHSFTLSHTLYLAISLALFLALFWHSLPHSLLHSLLHSRVVEPSEGHQPTGSSRGGGEGSGVNLPSSWNHSATARPICHMAHLRYCNPSSKLHRFCIDF